MKLLVSGVNCFTIQLLLNFSDLLFYTNPVPKKCTPKKVVSSPRIDYSERMTHIGSGETPLPDLFHRQGQAVQRQPVDLPQLYP